MAATPRGGDAAARRRAQRPLRAPRRQRERAGDDSRGVVRPTARWATRASTRLRGGAGPRLARMACNPGAAAIDTTGAAMEGMGGANWIDN